MAESKLELGRVYSPEYLCHSCELVRRERLDAETVRYDGGVDMIYLFRELPESNDNEFKLIRVFNLRTGEMQREIE